MRRAMKLITISLCWLFRLPAAATLQNEECECVITRTATKD